MEKNKYLDNRLAEEFDLIVLVNNTHRDCGLPSGSLGTLTYSYTGRGRPLYGLFTDENGEKKEQSLRLRDFRVLNEKNRRDCSLIAEYMARLQAESPQNS